VKWAGSSPDLLLQVNIDPYITGFSR
jgi:hypothetical protein